MLYIDSSSLTDLIESLCTPELSQNTIRPETIRSYKLRLIDDTDKLISIIQKTGKEIDIGLESAFERDGILYSKGYYVIDSIFTQGKCITDVKENYADLINLDLYDGTICFSSKCAESGGIIVKYKTAVSKTQINLRHIIDILAEANLTIKLAIIGHQLKHTDKEYIIKPIMIEYLNEDPI